MSEFTYDDAMEMLTSQGHTEEQAREVLMLFMAHTMAGTKINARPTCEDCFISKFPHQHPLSVPKDAVVEETCYLCGKATTEGIYS